MDRIYRELKLFPENNPRYNLFQEWVVLNHGRLEWDKNKKETYESKIWLAPANWYNQNNKWNKLTEEEKKRNLISKLVSVDFLTGIIPGTVLNKKNEIVGRDKNERMIISIPSESANLLPNNIANYLPEEVFKNSPFIYQPNFPCIKIDNINEGKNISILIPSSEIARFYFFKGHKLIRKIFNNSFECEFGSSTTIITEEKSEIRTLFTNQKEGYTNSERIVLAQLASDENVNESVSYIYNNILSVKSKINKKDKKPPLPYIKTRLFQKSAFDMDVSGYYFDPPYNTIYIANQILHTSEKFLFDNLVWHPLIDHRSIKDKERRNNLPINNYKPQPRLGTSETNLHINPDDKPNSSSIITNFNIELESNSNSFSSKEIAVIKSDKIDQSFQYKGKFTIYNKLGNKITTNEQGDSKSETLKGVLNYQEKQDTENYIKYHSNFIKELVKGLKIDHLFDVQYFHPNENYNFQFKENIVRKNNIDAYIILRVKIKNDCFYIFEHTFRNVHKNRTALLNNPTGIALNENQINDILTIMSSHNYQWLKYSNDPKLNTLNRKGFNHKRKGKYYSPKKIASNIAVYINKIINDKEQIK